MLTLREERDHYTIIRIFPSEEAQRYRSGHEIVCADFDYSEDAGRVAPTPRVSLLGTDRLTADELRQLAATYVQIADLAEKLQAEKRAVYVKQFGED